MFALRPIFTTFRPIISRSFVTINFHSAKGDVQTVKAEPGETVLKAAQRNGIALEGACEGGIACATCHVIIGKDFFDRLPEASEEEEDCLDNATNLSETSRLGCQVKITEDLENMDVTIPGSTRNFYVDGHVPKPH